MPTIRFMREVALRVCGGGNRDNSDTIIGSYGRDVFRYGKNDGFDHRF